MMFYKINWKKIAYSLVFSFVIFLVLLITLKNTIFRYVVETKLNNFNQSHYTNIHIKDYKLKGFQKIILDSIIITQLTDTFAIINNLSVKFNLWKALLGDFKLKQINSNHLFFNIYIRDSINSFSLLFKKISSDTINFHQIKKPDFKKQVEIIFHTLFNLLPKKGNIIDISINILRKQKETIFIKIPFVDIHDYLIKLLINFYDSKYKQSIYAACAVNRKEKELLFKSIHQYKANDFVPGFSDIQLKLTYDTAFFKIKPIFYDEKILLSGKSEIINLSMHQPLISVSKINFNKLSLNYSINIDDISFTLDSTTNINISQLTFHPFVKYIAYPNKEIIIKISEQNIDACNFFAALPEGLFPNVNQIKAEGTFSYNLNFHINFKHIDSLTLNSELSAKKLRILSYGKLNLAQIDSDFVHTVYEKGQPVETILISYSNTNYIPFQQISPYIKNALLCTEDGGFYWHKGFLPDAFREALITNIKHKRFVRGGSTITMQLVKNLYLNRYKVISRKLEEMLIVWLLENLKLASKDRMFEIYLNIIEFGPSIYGINKACQFYFNKKPHELSLPEAIFLASIVPKPKHFAASFDSTGTLKQSAKDFLSIVAKKMYDKQMISEDEWKNFTPEVLLKGKAKDLIKYNDY